MKRRDGEKGAQRRLARSAGIGALLAVFACVASAAWAGESEAPAKAPLVFTA